MSIKHENPSVKQTLIPDSKLETLFNEIGEQKFHEAVAAMVRKEAFAFLLPRYPSRRAMAKQCKISRNTIDKLLTAYEIPPPDHWQ